METIWHYLTNQMLNVTAGSNVLGVRISNTHDGKLFGNIADPFISGLYTTYHPIHLAYIKANAVHKSKISLQKGVTDAFILLIEKLGFEDINSIDSAIQGVYKKGTPKYNALLGNGHAPFQDGTQEECIAALFALSFSMDGDALLAAIKADVDAIYLDLTDADTAQKGAFNAVELASKALETARIEMCEEQYGNLGLMMNEYKKDPTKATSYFDLKAIRNFNQTFFQNHVAKSLFKFIVERTVTETAKANFANVGVTTLRFYLSNKKTGVIGANFIELLPGDETAIVINTLGDVSLLHFFMVQNMDALNDGEFTLEFL